MAEPGRTPDGERAAARMAEARTQLVSAAQWLARVERSFAGRGSGEEFSLRWRADRQSISTRDIGDEIVLELRIDRLTMQFIEKGRPSDHAIDVEERSPAHVEAWILIELLHRGLDRDRFSKDLPYDTSALLNGDGVEFSPEAYEGELRALSDLFRAAAGAIGQAAKGGGADAMRISPRDLGVEAVANGRRIGFSLGDARIAEPYFYVAATGASPEPSKAAILSATSLAPGAGVEAITAFYAENGAATRH